MQYVIASQFRMAQKFVLVTEPRSAYWAAVDLIQVFISIYVVYY